MHIIGLRNIKTAIAVFITLFFKLILVAIFGLEKSTLWYTPFFAAIAAAYSMDKNGSGSLRQAKIRSMGSIIGGLYGILIVLLVEQIILPNSPYILSNDYLTWFISYSIYSIALVGAIFLAIKFRQAPAVFITCLTYLSVTVSIRNGGQPVVYFGLNRILSTIFGVMVSVCINLIRFPHIKNKNVLFVVGLDRTLLYKKKLTGFTEYKLNRLIERGLNITFVTTRTPSSVNRIFEKVKLNLPVVVMNGAATYDFETDSYSNIQVIPKEITNKIDKYILDNQIGSFAYSFLENDLIIYYNNLKNECEVSCFKKHKHSYFKNYVNDVPHENNLISYYIMIDKKEKILNIAKDIKEICCDEIIINYYPYEEDLEYYILKIQDNDASKVDSINALGLADSADVTIAFGGELYDIPMLMKADLSICFSDAPSEVIKASDFVIDKTNPDTVIKTIEKLYYGYNLEGHINKMRSSDK